MNWTFLQRRLRPFLIGVCVLFAWGAAANTGVGIFEFLFGIPFVWYLSVLLRDSGRPTKVVFNGLALLPVAAALVFPSSTNPLHYPVIGSEVTVPSGWGSVRYPSESVRYLEPPKEVSNPVANARREESVFEQTTKMRVIGVKTRHPDFGLVYYAVLRGIDGQEHEIREMDLLAAVKAGNLESSALNETTQLHRPVMKWLGDLMYWPLLPLLLAIWISSWFRNQSH